MNNRDYVKASKTTDNNGGFKPSDVWNRELGQRLKNEMRIHGYRKNQDIADFLGYSHASHISNMLNGHAARALKLQDAEKLEHEWKISKWWFFGIGGRTLEETRQLEMEEFMTSCEYLRTLGITIKPSVPYWICSKDDLKAGLDVMEKYLTDESKRLIQENTPPKDCFFTESICPEKLFCYALVSAPPLYEEYRFENPARTGKILAVIPRTFVSEPIGHYADYDAKKKLSVTFEIRRYYEGFDDDGQDVTAMNDDEYLEYSAKIDSNACSIGYFDKLYAVYIGDEYKGAFTRNEINELFLSVDQVAKAAATAYMETARKRQSRKKRFTDFEI